MTDTAIMRDDAISAPIRSSIRHDVRFEARIEPHPDHSEQFRLGFAEANSGLAVTDVSAGGLGIRAGVFIPKNMRLTVRVLPAEVSTEPTRELVIRAVVRCCSIIDHKPTYQVGLQFLDPKGYDEITLIKAAAAPAAPVAPTASPPGLVREPVLAGVARGQ